MRGHHALTDQKPASPGTGSLNRDIVIPPFRHPRPVIPRSGDSHVLVSAFFSGRVARLSRGHLLFRKGLARMPTLRRTANRQNANDFFSRTVPNSETAVVLVLRQRSFWNSFGTVGWVLASTCAKLLRNLSRGVAQPGSAPALGAGGRWFESSRPDHFSKSGVTPG